MLAGTAALVVWPARVPQDESAATSTSSQQLGQAFLGITDIVPLGPVTGLIDAKGQPLKDKDGRPIIPPPRQRVGYLLPFEIVSVHLTVVLIGAAYLARAKRRRGAVP